MSVVAVNVKFVSHIHQVLARAERATERALFKAAAYIRTTARRLIRQSKKPSAPGSPPHTRTGKRRGAAPLRNAIVFAVQRATKEVFIGPSAALISRVGAAHEHGLLEVPGRVARPNWRIQIGGHGPLVRPRGPVTRKIGRVGVAFIKIHTERQLLRVRETISQLPRDVVFKAIPPKKRKYPKRPFMRPAMIAAIPALPRFWYNAVT